MKWDINQPLKPGMYPDPVREIMTVDMTGVFEPTDDILTQIFGNTHSLKTWGRENQVLTGTPHWIAVYKPTELHTDFKYPRYTHHLILRCDECFALGGITQRVCVGRGMVICLDTHSPHILAAVTTPANGYYVACSIDMHEQVPLKSIAPALVSHARQAAFLSDEVIAMASRGAKK